MVNVELHGYDGNIADELRDRIFQLTDTLMIEHDLLVTVHATQVYDKNLARQPFIRLLYKWDENVAVLLDLLKSLNETIEQLPLDATYVRKVEFY